MFRVLIVDDEPALRTALERFVRSLGMVAETAEDGAEALSLLRGCDLVVSDVRMPNLTGMELLAEVRRRRPGLPVVLLTGYGTIPQAVEAMQAGAAGFLTKPFDLAELETVLEGALARAGRGPHADVLAGRSRAITALKDLIARVAQSEATVLVAGESGSGKEVVARAIHAQSRRARGRFVAVNCGAIPEPLLESELFGHVKGAFTGASANRAGLLAIAEGGTLLLDEIAEMPPAMQVKLLRVLQDRTYTPVGDSEPRPADVRIVAATHRDLDRMVQEGELRHDLYYRLNVLRVRVPPLREREDDVLELARLFFARACVAEQRPPLTLAPAAAERLCSYRWPGNVRELEHVVTRATVLARGDVLQVGDLPELLVQAAPAGEVLPSALPEGGIDLKAALHRAEWTLIEEALARTRGNRNRAAHLLGLNRTTLVEKLGRKHSQARER